MIDSINPLLCASVTVQSFGSNISKTKIDLNIIQRKKDDIITSASFAFGIKPMSKYEKRHNCIIWDKFTGRRRHPSGLEDDYNFFKLVNFSE